MAQAGYPGDGVATDVPRSIKVEGVYAGIKYAYTGGVKTDAGATNERTIPVAMNLGEDELLFRTWEESYSGTHPDARPEMIVRPQTTEDVATVVKEVVKRELDLVVRGGGHDVFGRFTAKGAVCIDLKDMREVRISEDKKTVRIGGGATQFDVVRAVDKEGLQVASGSCGLVGHAGWSIVGGFGAFMHSYGMGCDQIVGAKVVTADGEVVEASERMLKGLRGGGGNFGIVAELTIKAYPKTEVQAGMIMYDTSEVSQTVTQFFTNYAALLSEHGPLPRELYLFPAFWNFPHLGRTMTCSYTWNGPASDESRLWLDRALALAPLHTKMPPPNVVTTTSLGLLETVSKNIPLTVHGRSQGTSVERWTTEIIAALATVAETMPTDSTAAFHVHTLRPECPSVQKEVPPSVSLYRKAGFFMDILGLAPSEAAGATSAKWALDSRDLIMATEGAGKTTYLAQTSPERTSLVDLYGEEKLRQLMELKNEFDPKGVFCFAVPRLTNKRRDREYNTTP